MDELKIAINSAFMKRIIKTVLSKVIEKKLGYKIDIQINEIKADVTGGWSNFIWIWMDRRLLTNLANFLNQKILFERITKNE